MNNIYKPRFLQKLKTFKSASTDINHKQNLNIILYYIDISALHTSLDRKIIVLAGAIPRYEDY